MYHLNSVYRVHISDFIEMKRRLGFKCKDAILKMLDKFADERGETSPGITQEFAEAWGKRKSTEQHGSLYSRVSTLISFSSYLRDIGIPSHIPKLPKYHKNSFVPHIYSATEIESIFNASDNLEPQFRHYGSHIMCTPALLRLLYATGIRINEALALKRIDIDFNSSSLLVKDSKNNKKRRIPISISIQSVLKNYIANRDRFLGTKNSAYLFVKLNEEKCGKNGVYKWFRKCLAIAGIPYVGGQHGPRIHDLRHTFAVHSLVSMVEKGCDIYATIPVLSTYLGHQSLESTNHYVRMTMSMYPNLIKSFEPIAFDVFPNLPQDETD